MEGRDEEKGKGREWEREGRGGKGGKGWEGKLRVSGGRRQRGREKGGGEFRGGGRPQKCYFLKPRLGPTLTFYIKCALK